jgi:asparagine synthase (glutamine-hydrolysing)
MCGFAAILSPYRVDPFLSAVSHRGVRNGVVETSWGSLGHARLPIVGLGTEYDQPAQVGPYAIAFVGEILNFKDFRPNDRCDLPLVTDAWQDGPHRFKEFDGFWSIAALDNRNRSLSVLCDYLGQKPAYYRSDEYAVGAASEPAAVALMGPVTPDEIYFSSVIKWGYCPDVRRTPYAEVSRVLPGELVQLFADGRVARKIVDPLVPKTIDDERFLKVEIEEAVRRRVLSSDVPVAALVSGGLDSAITYTLAKRYGDVHAYHVENGEWEDATKVLGQESATCLNLSDVTLDHALAYMQEPLDLGSLDPQISLSDMIDSAGSENVCLTGDGADELFGGYGRAMRYDSQASDVHHELVAWHLPRLDRVMMRNRIEVRSPFLSREVARIALSLPYERRRNKQVLRDLFRDDLPAGVADVPKRPLRTEAIAKDREARSVALVEAFRRTVWG